MTAIVALVLAIAELVFLLAVAAACWVGWRKVKPSVAPLVSMFTPPPSSKDPDA